MSGRLEYKYLVRNSRLDEVRAEILPYMRPDAYGEGGGRSEYTVRSMYYDTPAFDCYLEKIDGVENRQKYRIRGYGEPNEKSIVVLEIKMKRGNLISKHRAPLLHTELRAFMNAPDIERQIVPMPGFPAAHDCARRFMFHYFRCRLRPAVLVVYDREAYFGRFDQTLRITFDKRVRGGLSHSLADLYHEHDLTLPMPHHFVLEVKFFRGALPIWVSNLIQKYSMQRMAVSKYALCMDSSEGRRGSSKSRRNVAEAASA